MKFEVNMGKTDRLIRLLVALLFAALNIFGLVGGTLGIVLWVLAAVFALTSFISFCPLYLPFKISTKNK